MVNADATFAGEPLKTVHQSPGTDYWQVSEMVNIETDAPAYASFPGSPCSAPGRDDRSAIDAAVAQVFGLSPQHMKSATRGRAPAALARQVAMYVTHISCGMSLTDVGTMFARDRTTVSHACAVIEDRRDDPIFDRILDLLEWIVRELLLRTGSGRLLSN